jgi:chromosomal replication initiator protein
MEKEQLWNATLGQLELSLSKANFTTWFKNTFVESYDNGKVIIAVPNTFTKAWFEKKYHDVILKALKNVTENQVREIIYKVGGIPMPDPRALKDTLRRPAPMRSASSASAVNTLGLNDRYTFETFVVGKGNELAKAAALAASEKPGEVYNPLFIYGGVGLGKTHLMQAIGHALRTLRRFHSCDQ